MMRGTPDLQKLYDDLGLYIESLEAQRVVLAANPNICTHPKDLQETTNFEGGRSITHCKHCRRVLRAVGFDQLSTQEGSKVHAKASGSNMQLWKCDGFPGRPN
jgi:hypothetical protein